MKKLLPALMLALTLTPVVALADDNNVPPAAPPAPPAPTAAQGQAFKAFFEQEKRLHDQLRSQVLSSLSTAHRQAVANIMGELAVSNNPDPRAAAKQLDAILSQGEQQRIVAAHNAFRAQSMALHQQMRTQMQKDMPPGAPQPPAEPPHGMMTNPDAGTLVLMILSHGGEHHMGMGMGMGMGHGWEGHPPQP